MPPSRRIPPRTPAKVPVRRPRVAGLHRKGDESPEFEQTEPVIGTDTAEADTAETETTDTDIENQGARLGEIDERHRTDGREFTEAELEEAAEALGVDSTEDDAPPPEAAPDDTARPAGKHRHRGVRRPDDLDSAETAAGARQSTADGTSAKPADPAPANRSRLKVLMALGIITLLLAATGAFFQLLSSRLTGEVDGVNEALTDSAGTSEVAGKLTTPIEKVFSYNYTDLAATEKAADDALIGKARCQYDQLFAKLREQVPAQKLIVTLKVRTIGVSRLSGDDAELFVFADQSTTRTDQNQTAAGGAQFGVVAQRVDGTWKIADFVMFDQPPLGAEPGQTSAAPTC